MFSHWHRVCNSEPQLLQKSELDELTLSHFEQGIGVGGIASLIFFLIELGAGVIALSH